jgi:hypothetical protein
MRLLAATSDDSVQGVQTAADETVGKITFGGSLGLILFVGIAGGLVAALLYRAVRAWSPLPVWMTGAAVGLLMLGAFGRLSDFLNAENRDFRVLSPTPLAAALAVGLAVGFGIVLALVHERLDRGMPEFSSSPKLLAYLPLGVLVLIPPAVAVLLIVPLVAAYGPGLATSWHSRTAGRIGRAVVGAALVAAVAVIAVDAVAIAT